MDHFTLVIVIEEFGAALCTVADDKAWLILMVCEDDVGVLGHVNRGLPGLSSANGNAVPTPWATQDESGATVLEYIKHCGTIQRATRDS